MEFKHILCIGFLVVCWYSLITADKVLEYFYNKDRYTITHSGGLTLLLDTKTGLVWRNVWDDNKSRIPNTWDLMEYTGVAYPVGEEAIRSFRHRSLLDGYEESKNK